MLLSRIDIITPYDFSNSKMRKRSTPQDPTLIRNCYRRGIMLDAWNLAQSGAERFGGRKIEYVPISLRMAWAETKSRPSAWQTAALMADFSAPIRNAATRCVSSSAVSAYD